MKIVKFPEHNIIFAENQPEYLPLPAHRFGDKEGRIVCCWKLSFLERLNILFKGKIWHEILTFNQSLQPQLLTLEKPAMKDFN